MREEIKREEREIDTRSEKQRLEVSEERDRD